MSTLYIIGTLGIPAAVAAIVTALINYRGGIRSLYTKYELEQQKELRELMGEQGFVKVAGGVQPGESPVRSRNCRAWRGSWAQRRVSLV